MTHPADFHLEWKPALRAGVQTAVVRTADDQVWWLHSRVDPVDEAQFLTHDIPANDRTLYVVLGFGLGYHVKALLDRVPAGAHVVVIEPDTGALSTIARARAALGLGEWVNSPRLHLLVCRDPAVLPLRLAASFSAYDALTLEMIPHLPSMRVRPQFYDAVVSHVREQLPGAAAAHLTGLDSTLDHDLANYWANLPYAWRGGDIDALKGVCLARPIIIVSAGPSLSAALPHLETLQGRVLIMATAPTVPVLLTHHITPDVVVSVDPFPENLAHFVPWDGAGIPLVCYQRVFRGILERYQGPVCTFTMREETPLPLKADSRPSIFFPGGSVAFSALQLAHHMGGSPVVFVGQDFAFADGRTHAAGVDYGRDVNDETPASAPLLQVPGVHGTPVTTNGLYYSYLLHMQEYLLAYQQQHPEVQHINASSGAVILGAEHRSLESLSGELLSTGMSDPGQHRAVERNAGGEAVTGAIVDARRPIDPVAARGLIRQWQADAERVLGAADRGASFDDLWALFDETTICAQATSGYRRVRYVFNSRYRKRDAEAQRAFRERFVEHLRHVARTVAALALEYQA